MCVVRDLFADAAENSRQMGVMAHPQHDQVSLLLVRELDDGVLRLTNACNRFGVDSLLSEERRGVVREYPVLLWWIGGVVRADSASRERHDGRDARHEDLGTKRFGQLGRLLQRSTRFRRVVVSEDDRLHLVPPSVAPIVAAGVDACIGCRYRTASGFVRTVSLWVVSEPRIEYLTLAQRSELEAELAELEGPRRKAASEAIKHAREFGDLSENFEYHAAKNEQGLLERRIHVLRERLRHAVTVEHDTDEHVGVGSIVEIADEEGETMEVEISALGGVAPDSPLGRALMGTAIGDVVDIEAPSGSWKARVLAIRRG